MKHVGIIMLSFCLVGLNHQANSDSHGGQLADQIAQSPLDNQKTKLPEPTIGNPQSPVANQPEPWYERVLRRINPSNFDYGTWLEQRRAAFLEATIINPFFWYSLWVTVAFLMTILAYAKHRSDFHKFTWMSAGWLADFYNETQFARDHADAAIEKYNQHIEKCNRAIESELDGSWKQRQTNEEAVMWRQKYEELARLLDESITEKKKLSVTLGERERTLIDLAGRLEDLEQKVKGGPFTISGQPLTINDSNKLMMNRINVLERQLREAQKRAKADSQATARP